MLVKNIDKLREGRCYIHTNLILYSFDTLTKDLLYYHGIFFYVLIILIEVKEESDERRLTVCGHKGIYLILDSLYA